MTCLRHPHSYLRVLPFTEQLPDKARQGQGYSGLMFPFPTNFSNYVIYLEAQPG